MPGMYGKMNNGKAKKTGMGMKNSTKKMAKRKKK
jgi:hypothetical protein